MIYLSFLHLKRLTLLKFSFWGILLFFSIGIQAQVTIGSGEPPHNDALLDLKESSDGSSNKGLLMPRVSLVSTSSANPLSGHIKGMIVYNNATVGDVSPGLYFNDGAKWVRAISESEPTPISGTWYKQGTNDLSVSNSDAIWHQNKVSIGVQNIPTTEATATLFVNGDMAVSGKYYTTSSVYADYVFDHYLEGKSDLNQGYKFKTLKEVKHYIYENKHLPGVTKINDLDQNEDGYTIDITSLIVQQLEKIEELYLHLIELNDKVVESQKQNKELTEELQAIRVKLAKLSLK